MLLVVSLVVLAACAPRGESRVRATADFAPDVADAGTLHDAEQILIRDCMRRQGFDYWVLPAPPVTVDRLFPYAIDDPEWARAHGFGPTSATSAVTVDRPNARYVRALPPSRQAAYLAALDGAREDPATTLTLPNGAGVVGHSTAGCTAQAEQELYGAFDAWFRARTLTDYLIALIQAEVVKAQAYAQVVSAWAACMRRGGLPFKSVPDARNAFLGTGRSSPSPSEVDAAVSEAKCARSSNVTQVARTIDHHVRVGLPKEYQTALATYEQLWRVALTRAPAITPNR
jgi:hypothetical protein